jgi:hypothetical protein
MRTWSAEPGNCHSLRQAGSEKAIDPWPSASLSAAKEWPPVRWRTVTRREPEATATGKLEVIIR